MTKSVVNKGDRYNRFIIVSEEEKTYDRMFLCQCDCGNLKVVSLKNLKRGNVKSCGCLLREYFDSNIVHGMKKHRLYYIWRGMLHRCNNPVDWQYQNYGGRGIKVCDEWEDIRNFIKDMDETYKLGLTIDRIDNDKGYSKYNCRWSTVVEQSNNRRNTFMVEFNGKTYPILELSRKLNIHPETLRYRAKHNKPLA